METKKHQHSATAGTTGSIYEYCSCGAVRGRTPDHRAYEDWHACDLCRVAGTSRARGENYQ